MMSVMQQSHHNYWCAVKDVALDANGQWIKCVLNGKFIVFHMNFRKYLDFWTSENFGKKFFCPNLFFFSKIFFFWQKCFFWQFFSKNFLLLSRPFYTVLKWYAKRQPILLKFHFKNQEMYKFYLLSRPLHAITDLNKFGMPNFGHSKFLPVFLH